MTSKQYTKILDALDSAVAKIQPYTSEEDVHVERCLLRLTKLQLLFEKQKQAAERREKKVRS
jgi:hypothetical protein